MRSAQRCCARGSPPRSRSSRSSTRRSSPSARKARFPNDELGEPGAELHRRDLEPTLTVDEVERLRIEAVRPAWGKELDDSILPAEAGLDETHVSFTKGCYPGQEPIARLRHRGKVNRSLRSLDVADARAGRRDPLRREGRGPGHERCRRPCARLRAGGSPGRSRSLRRRRKPLARSPRNTRHETNQRGSGHRDRVLSVRGRRMRRLRRREQGQRGRHDDDDRAASPPRATGRRTSPARAARSRSSSTTTTSSRRF